MIRTLSHTCIAVSSFFLLSTDLFAQAPKKNTAPTAPQQSQRPSRKSANRSGSNSPINKKSTAAQSEGLPNKAQESLQKVAEIKIEGYKKIERDAITSRLKMKEGDVFDPMSVRQDILSLMGSGFFYDVQVDKIDSAKGAVLTFKVIERPSVGEIIFDGNSELSDSDLTESSELKNYEILDTSKIQKAIDKIQKSYEEKGYFLAEIKYKIEDLPGNEAVRIRFLIEENDKVKVKRIHFIGNKSVADADLKSAMITKEGGFFSFVSGSGSYKQEAFDQDLRILNYTYVNKGYIQVKISRPEVSVTPDRKGIYIAIHVEEGDQYRVGTVEFTGDLLFSNDELHKDISIDESEIFVWETIQKDLSTLQAKYGDLGYAYANIIPKNIPHEDTKIVDLVFEIDKGNKVYFGKINISGNSRTRDKVIRREMMISEGELYNETRKRESVDRIRRLGFFEDVQFNSSTPVDRQDVMDLDVVVKERNTGQIQVGAGYSTFSKFIFNGQITQANLFGRGQNLGVSVDASRLQTMFNLNFTEPYFLDTRWSVGGDAFQSRRARNEFLDTKTGGALRVGHPLTPNLTLFGRYGVDKTTVRLDPTYGDNEIFPVESVNGYRSALSSTLQYDRRNDRMMPTDGVFASSSFEYAGLGGNIKYVKGDVIARYYKKVFWEFVFRNNLTYGFIQSTNGQQPPFTELFRLGGPYSLRGYQFASVGRRKFSNMTYNTLISNGVDPVTAERFANVVFGGRQQFFYQTEMEFPIVKEANIRGVVFFDIGDAEDSIKFNDLKSDVGFGFRWFSPIGPLRFEWGFPNQNTGTSTYRPVNFEFSIGNSF